MLTHVQRYCGHTDYITDMIILPNISHELLQKDEKQGNKKNLNKKKKEERKVNDIAQACNERFSILSCSSDKTLCISSCTF